MLCVTSNASRALVLPPMSKFTSFHCLRKMTYIQVFICCAVLIFCCSLVPCFEQGYKDAITEAQALRVNFSSESKKREALESHIADLKRGLTEISAFYSAVRLQFVAFLLISCNK